MSDESRRVIEEAEQILKRLADHPHLATRYAATHIYLEGFHGPTTAKAGQLGSVTQDQMIEYGEVPPKALTAWASRVNLLEREEAQGLLELQRRAVNNQEIDLYRLRSAQLYVQKYGGELVYAGKNEFEFYPYTDEILRHMKWKPRRERKRP